MSMDSSTQDLFDQHVEGLAQEFTSLSAHSRNQRSEFHSPAAHSDFQKRIELAIIAYLDLRCGCGRAATAGKGICLRCTEAMATDMSAEVRA